MPRLFRFASAAVVTVLGALTMACSGSSTSGSTGAAATHDAAAPPAPVGGDLDAAVTAPVGDDDDDATAPTPVTDAGGRPEAGNLGDGGFPADPTDGTPTRQACTGDFGAGLNADHGRLDGTLVAIVQPHTNEVCNGDTHVHLQVLMGGSVYDVATNLETLFYTEDLPLPVEAWSEGWHANIALDYAQLGIHSTQFVQPASEKTLSAVVTADLENANHISVFATGYGTDGIHDVHYEGSSNDGAIFIDPLSPKAHGLFFRFDTDTF